MTNNNKNTQPKEGYIKRSFDIIKGARRGDMEEVTSALEEDPGCINTQDQVNGLTALHFAASNGHYSMVNLLCDADGVDTSIPDFEGRTASHLAWVIGRSDIESRIDRDLNERLRKKLALDDAADNVTILKPNQDPKPGP